MAVTEAKLRRELRALLQTVDFETETERTVREKLAKRLKCGNIDKWKPLIKTLINAFLEGADEEEAPQEAAAPRAPPVDPPKQTTKRKADGGASGSRATKSTKKATVPPPTGTMGKGKWNDEGEWVSNLSDQKRVSVRAFKGHLSVDLREYYLKDGDWLPTKKGISLDLEQWAIVKSGMDAVLQKVQQGIHNHVLKLTGERKLQLRSFKGYILVDIREFYMKGTQELPGKKGISLTGDLFATLAKRRQDVDAALEALGGDPTRSVEAPQDGNQQPGGAVVVDDDGFSIALGPEDVRAGVSMFQGKILFSLRNFLMKSGRLVPGYKGISLLDDQFDTLMSNAERITLALTSVDTSLNISIAAMRRVSISTYSGQPRVDVREFYNSSGEIKPGKKGISLGRDQWEALLRHEALLRSEADKL